ncbi:MAG: hypothetical protein WBN41_05290 [Lysobacterales bacterium]
MEFEINTFNSRLISREAKAMHWLASRLTGWKPLIIREAEAMQ